MTTFARQPTKVPTWLLDALQGDAPQDLLNKRTDLRYEWYSLASLQANSGRSRKPVLVKIINVSSNGVGLISRTPVGDGVEFQLAPDGVSADGTPFEPVRVSVVHCTQTVQGYKIGCVFV